MMSLDEMRCRVVAIAVALAGCGPSLVVDDDGETSGASASATSSATVTETADDGPGTSPTTSPSTTANPTAPTSMDDAPSTDATADGDDDTVDTEGCLFIDSCGYNDGGTVNIECDVWAQDCPIGEKCIAWGNDGGARWNATRCSPVDPAPGGPGDPCLVEGTPYSGIDDCDVGMMCWDVDPLTNQGTCAALCGGSEANPQCDDAATLCMIEYDGVVQLCVPPCDPRLQDCIATSECVPSNHMFFCVPDQSGAEGQTADGCTSFDACDPGLFCASAELVPECADEACCTEFCDLALPDPNTQCTANEIGAECVPWFEDGQAPPGYELVGACVLPS